MKMRLDILGPHSYDLPPIERELSELTVQEIITKSREFWHRYEKASEINDDNELAPMYYMQLLAYYPVSLCKRDMSDTLKLLITMSYYANRPKDEKEKTEYNWNGFSYESLSLIFVRSKASIHAAVRDKELEAKELLKDVELRVEAQKIALSELIIEEKQKLREKGTIIKGTTKQTNERAHTLV